MFKACLSAIKRMAQFFKTAPPTFHPAMGGVKAIDSHTLENARNQLRPG